MKTTSPDKTRAHAAESGSRSDEDRFDAEYPSLPLGVAEDPRPYPAGLSVRAGSKNHLPINEDDHEGE